MDSQKCDSRLRCAPQWKAQRGQLRVHTTNLLIHSHTLRSANSSQPSRTPMSSVTSRCTSLWICVVLLVASIFFRSACCAHPDDCSRVSCRCRKVPRLGCSLRFCWAVGQASPLASSQSVTLDVLASLFKRSLQFMSQAAFTALLWVLRQTSSTS